MKFLAQIPLGNISGPGLGPFGANPPTSGGDALTAIIKVVSAIIGFLTLAAFIWFMFQLVIGGIQWVTSGGDKNSLESARNKITHALMGLIIVGAIWAIFTLVSKFLGLNFPNLEIPSMGG